MSAKGKDTKSDSVSPPVEIAAWATKLSPVYLDFLMLYPRIENSPDKVEEILDAFLARNIGNIAFRDIVRFEVILPALSIAKYRKTHHQLIAEVQAGDLRSIDQLAELYKIWLQSAFAKNKPKDISVKVRSAGARLPNPVHTFLIAMGLFAGGIENLNVDEMSELFDQYCYCKQEHSGEALVRMRSRLVRILKREA